MGIQDILMPGEKILSECKPFYATSRRIIRYDETAQGEPAAEVAYDQLAGVEVIRISNHTMMILGTIVILFTLFLTGTGYIFITSIPGLIGGAAMLAFGARGKLGYYQLHIKDRITAIDKGSEVTGSTTIRGFMESLGLGRASGEARWNLEFSKAGSFIATIRTIKGELTEL